MQSSDDTLTRDRRVRNRTIVLTVVLVVMGVVGGLLFARWKERKDRAKGGSIGWEVSQRTGGAVTRP